MTCTDSRWWCKFVQQMQRIFFWKISRNFFSALAFLHNKNEFEYEWMIFFSSISLSLVMPANSTYIWFVNKTRKRKVKLTVLVMPIDVSDKFTQSIPSSCKPNKFLISILVLFFLNTFQALKISENKVTTSSHVQWLQHEFLIVCFRKYPSL